MTKKDYELIGASIKYCANCMPDEEASAVDFIVRELMYRFSKENPKFDKAKFREICGIQD